MEMPLAVKIKKDHKELNMFAKQLLDIAINELEASTISEKQYSRIVDLITCMNIKTEEMSFEITSHLNYKKRKQNYKHEIDIKA